MVYFIVLLRGRKEKIVSNTADKIAMLHERGTELIKASCHPRIEQVLREYNVLVKNWKARLRVKKNISNSGLSDILQKETSDFALYVFGKQSYSYFGSEMTILIEKLFGLAKNQ